MMKLNNILTLLVLGCVLTITGTGCHVRKQHTTLLQDSKHHMLDAGPGGDLTPAPPVNPQPGDGMNNVVGTKESGIPANPNNYAGWNEDRTTLAPQTVYFDFDKSAIRASEQSKLDEVAGYLKSNAEAAIRVEGNCDERGTEEYNRSLGDRRAMAAREYLANRSIDPNRVVTLSNGEDKPAEHGHGENVWSKNRRDEFIILTPPKP